MIEEYFHASLKEITSLELIIVFSWFLALFPTNSSASTDPEGSAVEANIYSCPVAWSHQKAHSVLSPCRLWLPSPTASSSWKPTAIYNLGIQACIFQRVERTVDTGCLVESCKMAGLMVSSASLPGMVAGDQALLSSQKME